MRKQRGFTMTSVITAMAIIAILAGVLYVGVGQGSNAKPLREDGKATTALGAARYAAIDKVCMENLRQARQGVELQHQTNDAFPPSLEAINIGQQFYECPVGKEKYAYDPATGKVSCPHVGHESY